MKLTFVTSPADEMVMIGSRLFSGNVVPRSVMGRPGSGLHVSKWSMLFHVAPSASCRPS